MDILSYLAELVKTRKEVGIPGIGTFYKRKLPGRYDSEKKAFVPPSFELEFTEEVREHLALAEFISKEKNISLDSSNYFLGQFAEGLKAELHDKGTANLAGLGFLKLEEEVLSFVAGDQASAGFAFFGLPKIKEPTLPAEEFIQDGESNEELHDIDHQDLASEQVQEDSESVKEELDDFVELNKELPDNQIQELNAEQNNPEFAEEELDLIESNEEIPDAQISQIDQGHSEQDSVSEEPGETLKDSNDSVKEDEDPIYEEISEVSHYEYQSVPEVPVYVETVENLEEEQIESVHEIENKAISDEPIVEEKPLLVQRPGEYSRINTEDQETASVWTFYNSNNPDNTVSTVDDKKATPLYIKLLIALAFLIAILVALYFVRPELFENKAEISTESSSKAISKDSLKSEADTLAKADSISVSPVVVSEDTALQDTSQIKPEIVDIKAANPTPSKETSLPLRFEILAASLANKTEADNFLAQMKKRGIKAKIADLPGKKFKITLGTFSNEAEAKKELEVLKERTKIPDIYIFPVKHTNTNHK